MRTPIPTSIYFAVTVRLQAGGGKPGLPALVTYTIFRALRQLNFREFSRAQRAKRAVRTLDIVRQFPPLVPFFMAGLFVGLAGIIFDVRIRPPLLIINHSI